MGNIDIKSLISKINIVDVISEFSSLIKAGSSYKTLCNVHGDSTPSLSINPRKQIYKCFVCDHGGDALDYLIWSQKFSYNQAVEYLVKLSGEEFDKYNNLLKKNKYNDSQQKLINALNDANSLFKYFLEINKKNNLEVKKFVDDRKLTDEIIKKYSIGFAPNDNSCIELLTKKQHDLDVLINASILSNDVKNSNFKNRIIFPIFDESNNVIGFSGRKIDNSKSSKYINSKESQVFKKSNIIYNYQNAYNYDQIIIVEGFFDVIALHKIGFENAIALMGTNLSNNVISKLKKHKEIIIFLDSDDAGLSATLKLIKLFLDNNINSYVVSSNLAKDPDEILNTNNGHDILKECIKNRKSSIDWLLSYSINNTNLKDYQSIENSIKWLSNFMNKIDVNLKKNTVLKISNNFNLEPDYVAKMINIDFDVIKFNSTTKIEKDLKNQIIKESNEPINIRKILIWIWKNPSYIEQLNPKIEKNFISTKYKKIYEELLNASLFQKHISNETEKFLIENEKSFSAYSIPKSYDEILELLDRLEFDKQFYNESYLNKTIKQATKEQEKLSYLKVKQNVVSKKTKE